jgi:hypothetical protein
VANRLQYYRRIFASYLGRGRSQLTFWHETPAVNPDFDTDAVGQYYMTFRDKADYPGPFDDAGIPQLDYHGEIGKQHNPIAIAQYGLANYNLYALRDDPERRERFLRMADWMVDNLEPNPGGAWVWNHYFNWEYRDTLVSPWYSGLAQGQGISLLARAAKDTNDERYVEAQTRAFETMLRDVSDSGTLFIDEHGHSWIEEYIVDPPTHILNGFMWALWGVYDHYLSTGAAEAKDLFDGSLATLRGHLGDYDTGFWSLYEQSGTRLKMVASPFYHSLHIVQLRVMARLTGDPMFDDVARRWTAYRESKLKRRRALAQKAIFKLVHY